jgi:hypothetical protein
MLFTELDLDKHPAPSGTIGLARLRWGADGRTVGVELQKRALSSKSERNSSMRTAEWRA